LERERKALLLNPIISIHPVQKNIEDREDNFFYIWIMWNVYRHIRLDKNEPFYIGIGKTKYRAKSKYNRSIFWHRIVSKTDYEIDILFDNLTWEQAKEKEKEFIKLYGRKDLGNGSLVNMTDGGDGSSGLSIPRNEEWIEKISKSQKGKKKDPKVVEKARITRWGKDYQPEYKKIKEKKTQKGRVFSEEHKLKLSLSRKGMKFSEEHRKNLSLAKLKK
jgi:hypothetical protein